MAELDKFKDEIIYRYCHENWTLNKVVAKFNEAYGFNFTRHEYHGRLRKWGVRKYLHKKDLLELERTMASQAGYGRTDSVVLLNGQTPLSRKQYDRRLQRLSFTDRIIGPLDNTGRTQDNTAASTARLEAHLPLRDEDFVIRNKPSIPQFVMNNLPTSLLEEILLKRFQSLAISPQGQGSVELDTLKVHPAFVVLKLILFMLVNGDWWPHKVHPLLNQMDVLGPRPVLTWFLSYDSGSIQAICNSLLPILYLRGDKDLIFSILQSHQDISIDLYKILDGCVRHVTYSGYITSDNEFFFHPYSEFWQPRPGAAESRQFSIHTPAVIEQLRKNRIRPSSIFEAQTLLFACKAVLGDLSPFFELWDPDVTTVADMETSKDWTKNFRLLPLFTDNADHIRLLSARGFSLGLAHMLLAAISQNNIEAIKNICSTLSDLGRIDPTTGTDLIRALVVGEKALNLGALSGILEAAAQETVKLRLPSDDNEQPSSWYDHLALYLGSIRGNITDSMIKLLESKYRSPEADIKDLHHAVNCFQAGGYLRAEEEYLDFNYPLRLWGRITFHNSSRILRAVFKLGVHPSATKLWPSIWKHFFQRAAHKQDYDIELLNLFLDAGADINGSIEFEYLLGERSLADICKVATRVGFGDRTPLALAFYLTWPDIFTLILSRGAKIETSVLSRKRQQLRGESLEFLDAVGMRDNIKIKALWEARLVILAVKKIDPTILHTEEGFAELVQHILDTCPNTSDSPKKMFWPWVEYTAKLKAKDDHYKRCLEVIRYLINPNSSSTGEDPWDNPYLTIQQSFTDDEARKTVNQVIIEDKPDLLELLIRCPAGSQIWNKVDHVEWRFVDLAATFSLDCLKVLKGLGITIEAAELAGSRPLSRCVEANDIDTIKYLLAEGANIYATKKIWTASESVFMSAVEQAVCRRKIDIVGLFLEVDPSCYDQAQAVAENFNIPELQKYLKWWKQKNDSAGTNP
ncbi:hypothetical protein Dda_4840 [Drechslerella dactyloides]|uniref:Clr5 domain-containing protein n=1 Tax=Drechslerella dactyloides TaxID=74499 RepID=A0AAD6IZ35_DREDA|nr:hypothetical protein Dda_4840 [Drechslerella dactyloides]